MHYPKTERQAEFMALADRLAEDASARAAEHDRDNTFPVATFRELQQAGHLATNHAIRITDLALRVVSAVGLSRSQPLERYFRDARAGLGHPPMDDVALTQIGKTALGL